MNATPVQSTTNREVEVGIFESVEQAEAAVRKLLEAAFSKEEITVICSDQNKEQYFREFEHQEPAGAYASESILTGMAVGALLGAIPVVGAAIATGSLVLWVAGPAAAGALGVAGGIVGAMSTRGWEKELANYYQQAVTDGAILVAAEASGLNKAEALSRAENVLRQLGAKPLPLPEG